MVGNDPFISRESVRAVLEGMLYHSSETGSALEHLALVDDFLIRHNIPYSENRRLFVIRLIITNIITEQLAAHRNNFGLGPPMLEETLAGAQLSIQADVRTQSAELAGWSLLFYRFVRVDLNLPPAGYSAMSHVDERTLRRYQSRTTGRLRDLLVRYETETRLQKKRLSLRQALPNGKPVGIVGRSQLLVETRQLLRTSPPAHLLVTGPAGIGKTSFIHLLLYQQIEADEFDRVVWIDGAVSATYAQQYIHQMLMSDDVQMELMELRDFLALYRTAIVFDDIQHLIKDTEAFHKLLVMLADSSIYVIHSSYILLTPEFKHIILPELTKTDVTEIATQSRGLWTKQEELTDYINALWQTVGGNPLAVKLAANIMNNISLRQPAKTDNEYILRWVEGIYQSLGRDSRQALAAIALCPPFELAVEYLTTGWRPTLIKREYVVELVNTGLLQHVGDDRYSLSALVRRYIEDLYAEQTEIYTQVNRCIDEITHCLMANAESCWAIAEYILLRAWPELSVSRRLTWIELACDYGIRQGHYAAWADILRGQGGQELSLDLRLRRVECLRRLGERKEAEQTVQALIETAGQNGDFIGQGRGNLELSVLLRQQGLYERAYASIQHAIDGFRRFGQHELVREAELEMAQIAFDTGELTAAQTILQKYELRNIKSLSLQGEIYLAFGETEAAQRCVADALDLCQPETAIMGRLYAEMGRICFTKGDWAASEHYLTQAVVLLETHADQFALARTKANLAAGLLNAGRDYTDAQKLLMDAQTIQAAIRDRHGLMITRHNLDELKRRNVVDD
jgi:tetratricopeptide (TPR) repeat protein